MICFLYSLCPVLEKRREIGNNIVFVAYLMETILASFSLSFFLSLSLSLSFFLSLSLSLFYLFLSLSLYNVSC